MSKKSIAFGAPFHTSSIDITKKLEVNHKRCAEGHEYTVSTKTVLAIPALDFVFAVHKICYTFDNGSENNG